MEGYLGSFIVFLGLVLWVHPALKDISTQLKRIADFLENMDEDEDEDEEQLTME